ncbi:MAG: hypothetical protein II336_02055 [Loktanella sp.]|nr:hypothetical protein [Loktanella sp.]
MQIAFHIGANCTDEDRLLKSVLKNADVLLQQGIGVPGPGKYRSLIREAIQRIIGTQPDPDSGDILLAAITETDNLRRLVLSNDNFISVPARIFDHDMFYPQAETKVRALHRLFPDEEIALFYGIRNPASFLQETVQRVKPGSLDAYLGALAPEDLRWSDVLRRIKKAAPDTPLTVWCNEDTPLLWDQLIRRLSGADPQTTIAGGLDLLARILTPAGLAAVSEQIARHPDASDADRHALIAEIWTGHAIPDAVEDEIEIAELDADLVDHLTRLYAQDLEVIASMDGVELLLPFT